MTNFSPTIHYLYPTPQRKKKVFYLLNFGFPCPEQIVCALGFIAIDSPSYRDLVLNHGVLLPLLSLLNPLPRLSMVRVTTWTLYSLVRGKPPVNFEQVRDIS